VRNRNFPVWQRIFLLGTLCRRLDGVARGEVDRGVVPVLEGFSAALSGNSLRDAMETIKPDLPLQLDIVLKLAGICRERKSIGARFLECVEELKRGIGGSFRSAFKAARWLRNPRWGASLRFWRRSLP